MTYATTPMGADHTAGYAIAQNVFKVGGDLDPLSPKGQAEASRELQVATAALDCTGMCLFVAFATMDQPETFQALVDMLNSFSGLSLTGDDVVALGRNVLTMERNFTKRPALPVSTTGCRPFSKPSRCRRMILPFRLPTKSSIRYSIGNNDHAIWLFFVAFKL